MSFSEVIMENIHGNNGSIVDIINDPFGFTLNEPPRRKRRGIKPYCE
jgi:hypothetical protein